jgi:hypothetical protein
MKPLATVAFFALGLSTFVGCKDPGQAFVDDVCACKDKACIEAAFKDHETKFPESKMKLGEMDKLDEKKKKQLGEAMACVMKVGIESEKKK